MSTQVSTGHVIDLAIEMDDANGHPMLIPPAPDSPPVWTQTGTATGTLTVDADAMSAVYTPMVAGTDQLGVTVVVGGHSFAATIDVVVTAELQVLTSIQIIPTVK